MSINFLHVKLNRQTLIAYVKISKGLPPKVICKHSAILSPPFKHTVRLACTVL